MNSRRFIRSPRRRGRAARRHGEAERLGGLEVDHQLELGRLHDRQVGRLLAFEDAAGIDAELTTLIRIVGSVAHQPAGLGKVTHCICRGNRMMRRQGGKLHPPAGEKGVGADEECVGPVAHKSCEGSIDLAAGASLEDLNLQPDGKSGRFHVVQRGLGWYHRPD